MGMYLLNPYLMWHRHLRIMGVFLFAVPCSGATERIYDFKQIAQILHRNFVQNYYLTFSQNHAIINTSNGGEVEGLYSC